MCGAKDGFETGDTAVKNMGPICPHLQWIKNMPCFLSYVDPSSESSHICVSFEIPIEARKLIKDCGERGAFKEIELEFRDIKEETGTMEEKRLNGVGMERQGKGKDTWGDN